jgi:hypothetical protein
VDWNEFIWLMIESNRDTCDHVTALLDPVKGEVFFDELRHYQLVKYSVVVVGGGWKDSDLVLLPLKHAIIFKFKCYRVEGQVGIFVRFSHIFTYFVLEGFSNHAKQL